MKGQATTKVKVSKKQTSKVPKKTARKKVKSAVHNSLCRDITFNAKPSSHRIPRSMFRGDDVLAGQQELKDKYFKQQQKINSIPTSANDQANTTGEHDGRRPDFSKPRIFTPEEQQEIKDYLNVFSPEMMEKYPLLKVAAMYSQKGEWEQAKDALLTATKALEIDVSEDEANAPIFDPTKHKNFAHAMSEFIYAEPKKSITSELSQEKMKLRLDGATPEDVDELIHGKRKKPQHPAGQISSRYVSSPDLPKRMPSTPQQWETLFQRHKNSFESFHNPSFLKKKAGSTSGNNNVTGQQQQQQQQQQESQYSLDSMPSATEIRKSGNNPFYLPNGRLNVRWIQSNAQSLQEDHRELVNQKDYPELSMILKAVQDVDMQPDNPQHNSPYHQLYKDSLAARHQRDNFESVTSAMLGKDGAVLREQRQSSSGGQAAPQFNLDTPEARAQVAFGSIAGNVGLVPTLQQLIQPGSTYQREMEDYRRRFAISKTKLDMEVGYPFLQQLESVGKMSLAERDELGKSPLYGSLAVLTSHDVEKIKREYDFTDPKDLAQYIMRFLGRSIEEIDHRFNIDRKEYDEIQHAYLKEQAQLKDVKSMAKLKSAIEAAIRFGSAQFDQKPEQSDVEDEIQEELRHGSTEKALEAKMKKYQLGLTELPKSPNAPKTIDDASAALNNDAVQNTDQSRRAVLDVLTQMGNTQSENMLQDFLDWQNQLRGDVQTGLPGTRMGRGLGGLLAEPLKSHTAEFEQLEDMALAFGATDFSAQTSEEKERLKELTTNINRRRDFEQRLNDAQLAHFRARQIALKVGKIDDEDWIRQKYKNIFNMFKFVKRKQRHDDYENLRKSCEDRAEKILSKTTSKLHALYKKYLPEEPFNVEQAMEFLNKLNDVDSKENEQLDHAKELFLAQNKAQIESIKKKAQVREETNQALRERQEALMRRSREIALVERRMELQAQGKTPAEIAEIEELDELDRVARGMGTEDIIRKNLESYFDNAAKASGPNVKTLIKHQNDIEQLRDPAKMTHEKELEAAKEDASRLIDDDLQNTKRELAQAELELRKQKEEMAKMFGISLTPDGADTTTSNTSEFTKPNPIDDFNNMEMPTKKVDNVSATKVDVNAEEQTPPPPPPLARGSLLDRVRKRKVMKEFEDKKAQGDVVIGEGGSINLTQEYFKKMAQQEEEKRIALENKKFQEELALKTAENAARNLQRIDDKKVSDDVFAMLKQEEEERNRKLEQVRQQQREAEASFHKKRATPGIFDEFMPIEDATDNNEQKQSNDNKQITQDTENQDDSLTPEHLEAKQREDHYQKFNKKVTDSAITTPEEEALLQQLLGGDVPLYNRPKPIQDIPPHMRIAFGSSDDEAPGFKAKKKVPDHVVTRPEHDEVTLDLIELEHRRHTEEYKKKLALEKMALADQLKALDEEDDITVQQQKKQQKQKQKQKQEEEKETSPPPAAAAAAVTTTTTVDNDEASSEQIQSESEILALKQNKKKLTTNDDDDNEQQQQEQVDEVIVEPEVVEDDDLSLDLDTEELLDAMEDDLKRREEDERIAEEETLKKPVSSSPFDDNDAAFFFEEFTKKEIDTEKLTKEKFLKEQEELAKRKKEVVLNRAPQQQKPASALDAFFDASNTFDSVFAHDGNQQQDDAQVQAGDATSTTTTAHTKKKEKKYAVNENGDVVTDSEDADGDNDDNVVDIEADGIGQEKSMLELLAEEERKKKEEAKAKLGGGLYVKKSDTSLLRKLAGENDDVDVNNDQSTEGRVIDAVLDNSEDFDDLTAEQKAEIMERARQQQEAQATPALTSLKKANDEEFIPTPHPISDLSKLAPKLKTEDDEEIRMIKEYEEQKKQLTGQKRSVFDKLADAREKFLQREEELKKKAELGLNDDEQDPITGLKKKKKGLGLAAIQEERERDLEELKRKQTQDEKDLFLQENKNYGKKKSISMLTKAMEEARASREEMTAFINRFRRSMGLPPDDTLMEGEDFDNTELLDDQTLDDFYTSLAAASAIQNNKPSQFNVNDAHALKKKGAKHVLSKTDQDEEKPLHEVLSMLRIQDEPAFKLIMSLLYKNGGSQMIKITHALRDVQEGVATGEINSLTEFTAALERSGLNHAMIRGLQADKLWEDLEAEKLGLDEGGDLVDDEGVPIVQDPLGDYVARADRPLYSAQTTDLNLVAAKKRKERSTVFLDLDETVENDLTREIVEGKGLFKALTEKRISTPNNGSLSSLFELDKEKDLDSERYKSTGPAYDPNDPKSNQFDSFFSDSTIPDAKKSRFDLSKHTPSSRRSILSSLLSPTSKEALTLAQTAKKHQSHLRLTAPQDHDLMTTEELVLLDEGIRQRLSNLVDRLSRHTLLPPAMILQKIENPKELAKLLSNLTPDLIQEMSLVDQLMDANRSNEDKRVLLELADVKHPSQLTDKQTHALLADFQHDVNEFADEFSNKAKTIVFKEDKDRKYLDGRLQPGVTLGIEDPNRPTDPVEAAKYDKEQLAQRILTEDHIRNVTLLRDVNPRIDDIVEEKVKQQSLLSVVTKAMEEKDKQLEKALTLSIKDTAAGPNTRRLLVDDTLNRTGRWSAKRKMQLLRMTKEQMHQLEENQKKIRIECVQRLSEVSAIMQRGEYPLIEDGKLRAASKEEVEKRGLLGPDFAKIESSSSAKTGSMLAMVSRHYQSIAKGNGGLIQEEKPAAVIGQYDLKFAEKELIKYFKGDETSAFRELLLLYFNPATTPQQMEELATVGAATSVGRLLNMFGAILPQLPKQTEFQMAFFKFFQKEGAKEEWFDWTKKLEEEKADSIGRHISVHGDEDSLSHANPVGLMLRKGMQEADLMSLSPEIREKVEKSHKELELVFEDYRKVEVMLDRQLRLFHLEKERDKLGLPDFRQVGLIKHRFEVILSALQNPSIDNKRRQQLMGDAREVMAQMIALRNLKENDPELYYWNMFLAKIPPEHHKLAISCHNMPIDPMRLFDDLNPRGDLDQHEVLENIIRFLFEQERETRAIYRHIEDRSVNVHPGSPTLTLRDLRKEQLVCRRLTKMKRILDLEKKTTKEVLKKELSDQYMHQLRVLRMKELMDEPDRAEMQRQKLEFWLEESTQRGKKAGLNNVLVADQKNMMDLPVGAMLGNATAMVAHKKMLKRQRSQIDPILYNQRTARMFNHDKLNPLNQLGKVLQSRREKKKKARELELLEEQMDPMELAAINAAREGNRLLAYLGQHGAGSNNIQQDVKDLLLRQQILLQQQKKVLLLEASGELPLIEGVNDKKEKTKKPKAKILVQNDDGEEIEIDDPNAVSEDESSDTDMDAPVDDSINKDLSILTTEDVQKLRKMGLTDPTKVEKAWEKLPAVHHERKHVIDKQLKKIGFQLSQIVAKKEDFELKQHVRHDGKDVSLVHIANQPFVYARVVACYGQTVVVEQCGSNAYIKHSQYFVQDELEQIKRAAGDAEVQLSNTDNLDEVKPELDADGNPQNLLVTNEDAENLKKARAAIRGNRRRWHCHKSRHMELLTGDYVFIDPAPGRAWNSQGVESTALTTLNSMNATGAEDHGVVKAVFSRLNQVAKSSRSSSKLNHLEEANPICANSDHLVILCAAEGQPPFSTSLIDRYLAAAAFSGVKATIVYNKVDLIQMVDEAEKVLEDLKNRRARIQDKEKTLRKKLGKRAFRHMKRRILKDQKKQLRDTHFYTTTMQRYQNKLQYSEALAKELAKMDEEDELEDAQIEHRTKTDVSTDDIYEEDEHGRVTYKDDKNKKNKNKKDQDNNNGQLSTDVKSQRDEKYYSVPALVPRENDPKAYAIDYYYNDEEYDEEEEDRILLEQQLEKWITKKKRQHSREVEDNLREYERLGIKVIRISSKLGTGLDELEALLGRFHTTSFVGQSGVGKSTILNHLIPDLDLQTSNVSVEGKGTHTTTSSRMFHLPNGGSVIDTPGSQSFVPPAVEPEFVQELFPEIKALSKFCKLSCKCSHLTEVGCAVIEAVGDGASKAYIPVTITELFDPMMMGNLRVMEFRQRLESGELRDLAMNRPGNDPVLLYAQRYYQDLDAGKVTGQYKDVYVPTETGFDLAGGEELDEQGEQFVEAREHAFAMKTQDERHPANVIPLEQSDFEDDGTEQPLHIRKLKVPIRELREIILLKHQHYGADADVAAEFAEIEMHKQLVQKELRRWRNQNLRAKGLPVHEETTEETTEEHHEQLSDDQYDITGDTAEYHKMKKPQDTADKFDFNYVYDIEAMKEQILDQQPSRLVMEAEHINVMSDDHKALIREFEDDARETAKAMARIDLQDRLEAFKAAQKEKEEQYILEMRAKKLGISVEKLLEMQEKVKQKKEQMLKQQNNEDSLKLQAEMASQPGTLTDAAIVEEPIQQQEWVPPTMRQFNQASGSTDSVLVDDQGKEYTVDNHNSPLHQKQQQQQQRQRPLTPLEKAKLAEQKHVATYTQKDVNIQESLSTLAEWEATTDGKQIEPSKDLAETYRQEILHQIIDTHQRVEKGHNEQLKQQHRDSLTQRRFASRLPADSNAYVPEFRYKSYVQLYELMKKTEEFLRKRKKKSLTKQEEEKIEWRQKKEQERERREIRRRRVLIEEDPFAAKTQEMTKRAKMIQEGKAVITPLPAEERKWLEDKLEQKIGQIEDTRLTSRIRLLEEAKTKPMKVRQHRDLEEIKKEVDWMLTDAATRDAEAETHAFTTSMLNQVNALYDHRKQQRNEKEFEGLANPDESHIDHWKRTGHLKKTWEDMEALKEKQEAIMNLRRETQLSKKATGGQRQQFGQGMLVAPQDYSDDSEDNEKRREQYHQNPIEELMMGRVDSIDPFWEREDKFGDSAQVRWNVYEDESDLFRHRKM